MASTQSATSIDSAQVSWIESVGQAFSNVSDAFSSASAPASMAHCRAAFKPAILLRYTSTRHRFPSSRSQVMYITDGAYAARTYRDQLHLQRMVVW